MQLVLVLVLIMLMTASCREDKAAPAPEMPSVRAEFQQAVGDEIRTLTPVPEPTTLALMLAGGAMLGARRLYLRANRRTA